jgi:rifampicin phosphotransferase
VSSTSKNRLLATALQAIVDPRSSTSGSTQEWGASRPEGQDAIGGIAASSGVYRGRVRVIRSAADLHHLQAGEVLVCPETSSAWMMVFGRAGALVTDHGSTLSHTAIVAREFGLPAVVATANGTTRLRDGDEVVVDGNSGIVTRVTGAPTG